MKAEYNPEKLIRIDRQKGPLPNNWKARAMAHEEDIGRTNAAMYRKYLKAPADVSGQLQQPALLYFKRLAESGVSPEYVERHGELMAESVAEVQDFHTEVAKESDIRALSMIAENLRKEMKTGANTIDALQRDNITQNGPIESLPPEYINANTKNIMASLKLSLAESRLEELGVPDGERVSKEEWEKYRADFKKIHRAALRKALDGPPGLLEWYQQRQKEFRDKINAAGFHNDLYMTFHDTLGSSTGPERSPHPDYPGEYSLRNFYTRLGEEMEAKKKELLGINPI